ncbi:amidase [Herbidospora cretacea]|uniref:amidase n=1 Tax=Herbidospora cretacea TaxID=28444 RepID=UPI0007742650|nr:amidase [Herbidospora cretacea]
MTELHYLTASETSALLRAREISAAEVTQAHLDRIEAVNPQVNAIVTVTAERALDRARELDGGPWQGPLHGLPVAHKDLVSTKGVRTTFGSKIFADHVPTTDDLVVRRVRDAGGVMIGKTNTPEFGTGSHTVNEVFGATRNPYDLTKSAGGSSGGAAAALATGMTPLADGSDMGGSLRNPASFCNVAGLRPTPGRVPSKSTTAAWFTLGVSGPMARTVQDLALFLTAVAGPDPSSPLSIQQDPAIFGGSLETDVSGLRIAWSPTLGGLPVDRETARVTAQAAEAFQRLGATVEHADLNLAGADEAFRTYRAWWYAAHYDDLEGVGENVRWNVERGREVTGADLARAEKLRSRLWHRVTGFFGTWDYLIAPVSQVPPFPVEDPFVREVDGIAMPDYLAWMRSCYLISVLGVPALSVPCGFTADGLPVGVQIIGRPWDDLGVLRVGHAFEQVTKAGAVRPPLSAPGR